MEKDILDDAREAFELSAEAEADNRAAWLEDVRFARLSDQWPEEMRRQREADGRPCLTINRLPSFIRQVVNDARQNRPAIKVRPADDRADPPTAEVMTGLIRNIEGVSSAEVAYDTAVECAVTGGFGYFRIGIDYAHDDSFDLDIGIERVSNPLTVYGDPHSTAADSSDWNTAFVTDLMAKEAFERKYKGADAVDWDAGQYADLRGTPWREDERVLVAEYWTREEVADRLLKLSDGTLIAASRFAALKPLFDAQRISVAGERETRAHKVMQRILTGAEVLSTTEWAGRFIPIIPVYGDEIVLEGKRYFRSLIHDAMDAQRMFNYWRTTATELVALAPRVPFIGPRGAFATDAQRWATANSVSHAYIEYDGPTPPARQPMNTGEGIAAMQQALAASDDMKGIMGLFDAALGARSNETSGRAILARQREGDVATFHFADNLTRAIRHAGRILIDLIPKVYDGARVVRVLGEDGAAQNVSLGQPAPMPDGTSRIYDLAAGKYDLVVDAGPSFSTRREEAATQMTEMIRAFPQAAPVIGDLLAKNLDWPGADEIAKRLQAMLPAQAQGEDPRLKQAQQAISQATQERDRAAQEALRLRNDVSLDVEKLKIEAFRAETERLKTEHEIVAQQQKLLADAARREDSCRVNFDQPQGVSHE